MSFPYFTNVGGHSATVLEATKPTENWSDVTKVVFNGTVYNIGDTVHVNKVGYGHAKEFRPDFMAVFILQGDGRYCGKEALYKYSDVSYMCRPSAGGSKQKPNPNKAFKKKKARRF